MKGIILAGGYGKRLHPITQSINKHLLPIYDKPMIYYPLTTLMFTGIREILIITTPTAIEQYQSMLGDGHQWGIELSYITQPNPEGLAHAFILGQSFIGGDTVSLILGDNIFYGQGLGRMLQAMICAMSKGATLFAYYVQDPERYGIVELDLNGEPVSIEEKPKFPRSHYAITGLYFYDNDVIEYAKQLTPSSRGELEITDLNRLYLRHNQVHVNVLSRGNTWFDAGTPHSLLQASNFVEMMETRQGLKIACPEEVAWIMGYITDDELIKLAESFSNNNYGKYLLNLLETPQARVI